MTKTLLLCVAAVLMLGVAAYAEDAAKVKLEFKVKPPAGTAADAKLYIAGNAKELGEWKAGGVELKKQDDGQYTATVSVPKGTALEYKITRGDWDTVERKADGSDIDNRKHTADKDDTVSVDVAKWAK